jgi:hypothetical protein
VRGLSRVGYTIERWKATAADRRSRKKTDSPLRGIRHTAEVTADSLFEAAVLAPQAFRASGWVEGVGVATRLEVEVRAATTRHVVTVGQLQRWTEGCGCQSCGTSQAGSFESDAAGSGSAVLALAPSSETARETWWPVRLRLVLALCRMTRTLWGAIHVHAFRSRLRLMSDHEGTLTGRNRR